MIRRALLRSAACFFEASLPCLRGEEPHSLEKNWSLPASQRLHAYKQGGLNAAQRLPRM